MIPKLNKRADGRWETESASGLKGSVVRRECFSAELTLPDDAKYRGSYTDSAGRMSWLWCASFRRAAEYVYTNLSMHDGERSPNK